MATSTLLVFPVLRREKANFPKISFRQLKDHTFSLSDNVQTLNHKLWEKVIEERINLLHLNTQCRRGEDLYKILRWKDKDDYTYEDYRYIDYKPLCYTFIEKIAGGYQDVFERDLEAFEQDDFNVDLYAVVLLNRGEYFGHVYTWISPEDPNLAFFIGIRSRVDWIFYKSKYPNSPLTKTPISSLLFEGVRRFASIKGAKSMIIYQPLQVIRNIAPRSGFEPLPEDLYDREDIGRSIFSHTYLARPFEDALVRSTEEPIVQEVGEFILKE
ncbi:hypothetical protein [Cedratvirus kamchatka]|uniref:Uncharacterized protein n=1 Tax=Cedratvirus kamchatka TaxID=2716914 RepID=A0A6G8MXM8_9VIRU|nr:hypothetical protein [Cedratvirus kamchatka]WIL04779.1 hypothetical protein Cduv_299 [Cedratvirus duvanny]